MEEGRLKKRTAGAARWAVSLLIGIAFGYLALKDWPVGHVMDGLRLEGWYLAASGWRVHVLYLPAYFLTLVVMHAWRVWRWKPLLKPVKDVDVWTLNRVCSVGFLAMFVLPIRLGELVRPALLSTQVDVRRSPALATIVVERTVDGVMVSGFLTVALVFLPRHNTDSFVEIQVATYLALALFAALVAALVMLYVFRNRLTELASRRLPVLSGRKASRIVAGVLERFTQGLSIFPDIRNFLWFLLGSLMYWGSNCAGLYILSIGFDLGVPPMAAVAMMSTIVVGMMIPNPPGNFGTFWFFLLKPLELYGLSGSPGALVFALTVYTLQFLQLVLFGGWFIARGDVSFRRAFSVSWDQLAADDGEDGSMQV